MEIVNKTLYESIYCVYKLFEEIKLKKCKKMFLLNLSFERYNDEIIKYIIDNEMMQVLERIYKTKNGKNYRIKN